MSWSNSIERIYARMMRKRVVTESGCWEWTGWRGRHGYGKVQLNRRTVFIHRIAAHVHHGLDLDDSKTIVRHHCDNPPCFNPDHITPGTIRENFFDAVARGRAAAVTLPRDVCNNGHPIVEGNIVRNSKTGTKSCLICRREWHRTHRKPYVAVPAECVECGIWITSRQNMWQHRRTARHLRNAAQRRAA